MALRKVALDFRNVCESEVEGGIRPFGSVYSSRVELLASRADILNAKDRALLKMYFKNGLTFRQIAQVAGTSEGAIAKRIHKLTSKLVDSEYITCLRNREKFSGTEIAVARDYYLEGMSQIRISEKRKMTVYSIRKMLVKIEKTIRNCEG